MHIELLGIDPQRSFCEPSTKFYDPQAPGDYAYEEKIFSDEVKDKDAKKVLRTGELYVPGADKDISRICAMIRRIKKNINDIRISKDAHRKLHCAHSLFWRNGENEHPAPFTEISHDDISKGIWVPAFAPFTKDMLDYTFKIESSERNIKYNVKHRIWPEHCLIGTPGECVVQELNEVLQEWELYHQASVYYITKGSSILTEHYSIVKAEVPIPGDPSTQVDTSFIESLMRADMIITWGEALNFCLGRTLLHIAEAFQTQDPHNADKYLKKIWVVMDGTSPVPGFEAMTKSIMDEMIARGVNTTTADDILR